MNLENKIPTSKDNLFLVLILFISIFFILLSHVTTLDNFRNMFSYVFEPITNSANVAGSNVGNYLSTFAQFGKFQKEYNSLKTEVINQEAKYANYSLLLKENEALKQQLSLDNKTDTFVQASVLRDDDVNYILSDKGSSDGVKQGDLAILGNTFIGIVTNSDLNGSRIRLASDKSSYLEIAIIKADQENSKKNIVSNGIAVGSAEGIKIENIPMNSDVSDGDVVYINDSKVGGFWTLGYLVGLSTNPASTSRTAFVSPILDYDDLINVFIKIN